MEMCYDGALVMPNNYAAVNDEEMTYVDGGIYLNYNYYFSTGNAGASWCDSQADKLWGVYYGGIFTAAAVGGLAGTAACPGLGSLIGGIGGAILGVFMSDTIADWAKEWDYATMACKNKGRNSCYVNFTQSNWTISITVS